MPVKDYLKSREGMHDKFDRRLGIIGVALVFGDLKNSGTAWDEIDPILDKLLRDNDIWEEAPFLSVLIIYRYGVKNNLKVEFRRPDKKNGDLGAAIELDMEILEWADKNNYALLRDIFLVAALEAFVQVCKKYKIENKLPYIEEELSKYHQIPNNIEEAESYGEQGLRVQ